MGLLPEGQDSETVADAVRRGWEIVAAPDHRSEHDVCVLSAEELHRRGVDALNARRYASARGLLNRAGELATDPALRARVRGEPRLPDPETGLHR